MSVPGATVEDMAANNDRLTTDELAGLDLPDWRPVLDALHTRFRTGDFVTGLKLAAAIGEAAEEANHHPDLDLRYPHLDVRWTSHDVGGMSQRDVELARRTSALAADLGVAADPAAVTVLELGMDTWDGKAIAPFWAAVWGVPVDEESGQVMDPAGRLATVWFQDTDEHDAPRQRWHPDVWVPQDQVAPRVAAALAAGGTLVSDAEAPSFTVLADPQGNKVCLCTNAGRG